MFLLQFFAVFCRADSLTKIVKISSVSCIFKLYINAVWSCEHEWNITVDFCKRFAFYGYYQRRYIAADRSVTGCVTHLINIWPLSAIKLYTIA